MSDWGHSFLMNTFIQCTEKCKSMEIVKVVCCPFSNKFLSGNENRPFFKVKKGHRNSPKKVEQGGYYIQEMWDAG